MDPSGNNPILGLQGAAAGAWWASAHGYTWRDNEFWTAVDVGNVSTQVAGLAIAGAAYAAGAGGAATLTAAGPKFVGMAQRVEQAAERTAPRLIKEQAHLQRVLYELEAQLANGRAQAERLLRQGRTPNPHGLGKELEELPKQIQQAQARLAEITEQMAKVADK